MLKYVIKRVIISAVTLLTIIVVLFVMLQFMPGSPFNNERLTDVQRASLEAKYGLDKPLWRQFVIYVKNILTGDFGVSYSIQANYPVSSLIANKFQISIQLGLQAGIIGILLGVALGAVSALFHNGFIDSLTTVVSMIGASVPSQVLALGLVYVAAYKLGLFPLVYKPDMPISSTALATISLAIFPMAIAARFTRNEMLEVMSSQYITFAEAKGVPRWRVICIHAMKNTLVPLITTLSPIVIGLMTGSMVIENIFSIPGIGKLFIMGITSNDYNVVLSLSFIFSAMFIGIMLVTDLLYGVIDPRIRLNGGAK
ncbi:MAG: ABC transporter permease [Oscillospiraceae bacterium]|nr:ABC transporter permease [Oscillospiraceae bacterium]